MKLKEIQEILEAEALISPDDWESLEIETGGGADLMSDVLAFIRPGSLLLTGLTNPQVMRTAEMAEVAAVCFVRGKRPDKETLKVAYTLNIPVFTTAYTMFEACGRLYMKGLKTAIKEDAV